jgi:phospholipid/cholesterol/gamma-HCH transport system substrate-binding protein
MLMNEQGYKFGVGVLVVASMVIAIILILFFGAAPNFFANRYEVTFRFDSAPGVNTDTAVRKNGVPIGRVKRIKLLDEANTREGGVDLTLELDGNYTVRAGEQPKISKGSFITGDAVIELVQPTIKSLIERFDGAAGTPPNGVIDPPEQTLAFAPIKAGDYYRGGLVAPDPLDSLVDMQESVASTLGAIETAGNQVTALATDVRRMIGSGDGELGRISRKAEQTIDNFNTTLTSVNRLFNDPRIGTTLDAIAQRLPQIIGEAEGVMRQTSDTLKAFEGAGRAAETTINNVASFTEPFAGQGEMVINEAKRSVDNLNGLVSDLRQLSGRANTLLTRVNNGQGTLARLIDDDQLYYSVVNTLQNIEVATRRLQPIIEDARVFSDKIAREPSSLINIRGAITGQRGGMK